MKRAGDSPIELRLLGGLLVEGANRGSSIGLVLGATWLDRSGLVLCADPIQMGPGAIGLNVYPQVPFENYRIDFVVGLGGAHAAIECDGHDFHERTREQADRDTTRARRIERQLPVLRFTGSAIFRDPVAAAAEIWDFIAERSSAPPRDSEAELVRLERVVNQAAERTSDLRTLILGELQKGPTRKTMLCRRIGGIRVHAWRAIDELLNEGLIHPSASGLELTDVGRGAVPISWAFEPYVPEVAP